MAGSWIAEHEGLFTQSATTRAAFALTVQARFLFKCPAYDWLIDRSSANQISCL